MATSLLSGWSTCWVPSTVCLQPQAVLTTSICFTDENRGSRIKGTWQGHQQVWALGFSWALPFMVWDVYSLGYLQTAWPDLFFCLYEDHLLSAWPPVCPAIWWTFWVHTISHSIQQGVPSCLSTSPHENRCKKNSKHNRKNHYLKD